MNLTVNPDLRLIVEQPLSQQPLVSVLTSRGNGVPLRVQFSRNGQTYDPTFTQSSGTLTTGYWYRITSYTFGSGDDFTNCGAASNALNVFFQATDSTPANWTHGSILQRCDSSGTLFGLIWSVKQPGELDSAPLILVSGSSFTQIGSGSSVAFLAHANYCTDAINELLGVGTGNDSLQVPLVGEISWVGPEADKARTIINVVEFDVNHAGDATGPIDTPNSISFITAYPESALPGSVALNDSDTVVFTRLGSLILAHATPTVTQDFSGSLSGDVTGTQSATVVSMVYGVPAELIAAVAQTANIAVAR